MKNQENQKSRFRSFYMALAISLVMIFAACFFAYRQTSQTLENNLDSLTEQMEIPSTTFSTEEVPAVEIPSDVPKETSSTVPATQTETKAQTSAETSSTQLTETNNSEEIVHQKVPPLAEFSVLTPFSNGELVRSETTGTWQTHNGVDLSCQEGCDVFAIDTGIISEVANDALWGYTVTIDHNNGIVSRYCGLDGALEVQEGDTVQSGQKIGVVGKTPDIESALEPHLHVEVQKNGVYIDPITHFGE